MPRRRHQARHRARPGEMAGGEYRIRQELAEHHPEEGITARREGFRGPGRQVREIFFSEARYRGLTPRPTRDTAQSGFHLTLIPVSSPKIPPERPTPGVNH